MKILIVGGGMGGTILANNLARRLKSELKSGKEASRSSRHPRSTPTCQACCTLPPAG